MLRILGAMTLSVVLSTCPFGGETPDGFARVEGRVLQADGTGYRGDGRIVCGHPNDGEPNGFGHSISIDRHGQYHTALDAPSPYGRGLETPQGFFELPCRITVTGGSALVALRYVPVRFSRARSERPTTRVDLRSGELEVWPK
jgi:hypothetical protein